MDKEKKAVYAMRNNLNAARADIEGVRRAQFLLKELHRRTGMTQQALLSRCVNYCFDNDDLLAPYRADTEKAWKRFDRPKKTDR